MEEKRIKKKLTLGISSKKPYKVSQYTQDKNKTSVVIEKKASGEVVRESSIIEIVI